MNQETGAPDQRLGDQLRVYILALLLATFVSALHAGILFGLADLLVCFGSGHSLSSQGGWLIFSS